MITDEWPVYEPAMNSLSDLYEYEVEIDVPIEVEIDFQADEDPTPVMPSAWLIERCATSAALRSPK